MNRNIIVLLLVFLAPNIALESLAQARQQFTIPIGREIRPFDEYLLQGHSWHHSRVYTQDSTGSNTVLQDDSARVVVSAKVNVQAVTDDGQEAVKTAVIRNAQLIIGPEATDIVPTGTKLVATFSESGTTMVQDTTTLPTDVTQFLSSVIQSEGGLRTGAIMDHDGPVMVGQQWSVNSEALATYLGYTDNNPPTLLEGNVTFTKLNENNGRQTAVFELNATVKDSVEMLPGAGPTSRVVNLFVQVEVPVDTRYPIVHQISKTSMTAEMTGNGQTTTFEYHTEDERRFFR